MLLICSCGGSNSSGDTAKSIKITHRGDRMVLSADPQNDGFYILSLHAPKGGLTYQVDNSEEKILHSVDLVRLWNDSENSNRLADNPPTGSIQGVNADGVSKAANVEFYEPKWNKPTDTHTYRVKIIPAANTERSISNGAAVADEELTQASISFVTKDSALSMYTTTQCNFLVNTEGEHHSHAFGNTSYPNYMQFCRREAPDGYYFLSDAAVASSQNSSPYGLPTFPVLVVKASTTSDGSNAQVAPVGALEVWRDKGSKGDYDIQIFQPTAPQGYVCLGVIIQESYDDYLQIPANYRCVRSDLVVSADENVGLLWNDGGSGADQDVALGSPNPISQNNWFNVPNYGITLASPPDNGGYFQCRAQWGDQNQDPSCTLPYMLNLKSTGSR